MRRKCVLCATSADYSTRYTVTAMNPLPAPIVPGKTDSERFQNALRKVFTTPVKSQAKPRPKPKKQRPA